MIKQIRSPRCYQRPRLVAGTASTAPGS